MDPRIATPDIPKYLALASCGALLMNVEHVQSVKFSLGCLRIRFLTSETSLFLDLSTVVNLELVNNNRALKGQKRLKKESLFGVLDKTKTRSGRIFLRRTLLEPPSDVSTIFARQEVLEELLSNEDLFFKVTEIFKGLPDIEAAVSSLIRRQHLTEEQLKREGPSMFVVQNVLTLKRGLEIGARLRESIEGSTNPVMVSIREVLAHPELANLTALISRVIDPESIRTRPSETVRLQCAFCIRENVKSLLDVARKILSETIEDMHNLVEEIRTDTGSPTVSLSFTAKRGYHLSLDAAEEDTLDQMRHAPIQIVRQNRKTKFSTQSLLELNQRYSESLQEIWILSNQVVEELLNKIWQPVIVTALHKLCDATALLDALVSFAHHITLSSGYTRPHITARGPVAVRKGRHPVLEKLLETPYVPNDTYLSQSKNLHIITGVNMSGKTTYLKTVATMCILAHTGCWVPAEFASVPVLRFIASRIGTSDSIEQNSSSFSHEMTEVSAILQTIEHRESYGAHAPKNALVIVDELGRATTIMDGSAIAYAVAETLASDMNTLTLFSTHFKGLSHLVRLYPNVASYHMMVQARSSEGSDTGIENPFSYTFQLSEGQCPFESYGISTAASAGFPPMIIDSARQFRALLHSRNFIASMVPSETLRDTDDGVTISHTIYHRLVLLKRSGMDFNSSVGHLRRLRQELESLPR